MTYSSHLTPPAVQWNDALKLNPSLLEVNCRRFRQLTNLGKKSGLIQAARDPEILVPLVDGSRLSA